MDRRQRAAYDATRDFSDKGFRAACYAPVTSMYLDPAGDVRACCQNVEHVLGNVADRSLTEIWHGEPARELRLAMIAYDLSRGCRFCQWQFDDGNYGGALAHDFDGLDVAPPPTAWPQRLELAISNTCNLECIMCDGDLSSRIRSRREGRPPLPRVYDDRFFTDLTEFLPHLVEVRFLGGEPFLAAETFRVWDLMIDLGLRTPCKVTTNGTRWNDRVERVLDHFPVSVALSLDGVSRETVEAIRQGASYDVVMANLERFARYTRDRGTLLGLTFCLMRQNWHEFADYLLLADSWGAQVGVNTVIRDSFSLYALPLDDFAEVLAGLEARDAEMTRRLGLNAAVWYAELDRLRHWLAASRGSGATPVQVRPMYFHPSPAPTPSDDGAPPPPAMTAPDPRVSTRVQPLPPVLSEPPVGASIEPEQAVDRAVEGLDAPEISHLLCDADERVRAVGPADTFAGLPADRCVGRSYAEVVSLIAECWGAPELVDEQLVDGGVFRRVCFRPEAGSCTYVQAFAYPVAVDDDPRPGSMSVAATSGRAPAWAPVAPGA